MVVYDPTAFCYCNTDDCDTLSVGQYLGVRSPSTLIWFSVYYPTASSTTLPAAPQSLKDAIGASSVRQAFHENQPDLFVTFQDADELAVAREAAVNEFGADNVLLIEMEAALVDGISPDRVAEHWAVWHESQHPAVIDIGLLAEGE